MKPNVHRCTITVDGTDTDRSKSYLIRNIVKTAILTSQVWSVMESNILFMIPEKYLDKYCPLIFIST